MTRTNTTSRASFTRPGNVTYAFSSDTGSSFRTTITLPAGSEWTSGMHWHETHTEFLQVIQGVAKVTLNGVTKLYNSADSVIIVPRFARHEWRRGDDGAAELVVEEWTDPADGQKEIFFRNLSSVILDCTREGPPNELWLTWQLFVVFWGLDNWPVLYPRPWGILETFGLGRGMEWIVTHAILGLAVLVGRVIGLKSAYEEYTPSSLLQKKTQ